MKRLLIVTGLVLALATSTGVALADPGAPGTTFPEQPGANPQRACTAVTTNPGTGTGGQASQRGSPTAQAITSGLLTDACFGG
jgi:hypothetical protein